LRLAGFDAWFNSQDHEPPHFHLRKPGEFELRVFFLKGDMFELKWGDMPKAKVLKLLGQQVRSKRVELLIEWSKKVQVKP